MSSNLRHESPWHEGKGWLPVVVVLAAAIAASVLYVNYGQVGSGQQSAANQGRQNRHEHEDKPAVVAVETVSKTDFPVYQTGIGTVTALRTVTVRPRVDGELMRVTINEGQMVKAGDLLAEIDPRPFQIQLQQAEGQLLRDEALLKNAELDYARYQTLLEQDSIAAQQTMTQAAQVKQYRGNVVMDQAQVNNAKLQLSYAKLTAPISGRVGLRQIDQGNIVHANDSNGLVVITQLQPISVVFTLPEDKIPAISKRWHNKQAISVIAYDRTGKTQLAEGKLTAIDNQIDPTTGTIKLKAEFANNDAALFANQFVNVKLHLDTLIDAIQLSAAAVQNDSQGPFVYVVNADKTVQARHIALGASQGDKVVVSSGLAAGETVVLEGADQVRAGKPVDIAQKDGQAVTEANPDPNLKPEGKQKRDRRI